MASRKRRRDGDALDALAAAADAIGFDARAFERDGFAFLDNYALGEGARARALASALALRRTKEFASFNDADPDKRRVFALLDPIKPLLRALVSGGGGLEGFVEPGDTRNNRMEPNQCQLARRQPGDGFWGKPHIDTPHGAQRDARRTTTARHRAFAAAFRDHGACARCRGFGGGGVVRFYGHDRDKSVATAESTAAHYLGAEPPLAHVRARPGAAFIVHHQVLHSVREVAADAPGRLIVYFRVRAKRPAGEKQRRHAAMKDVDLEMPRLKALAARQVAARGREPPPLAAPGDALVYDEVHNAYIARDGAVLPLPSVRRNADLTPDADAADDAPETPDAPAAPRDPREGPRQSCADEPAGRKPPSCSGIAPGTPKKPRVVLPVHLRPARRRGS
ncbi:hypothetical protein JL720_14271 [Aureococcus anophagefferens]|nr:hypothetical protein JL720_14271 [Aureococcus anophagefferens]